MKRKSVCPKCEKIDSVKIIHTMSFPTYYHAKCSNCGARTHNCLTKEEAEARWNYGWLKLGE